MMDRNMVAGMGTKDALVWQPIHESHVKKMKDYSCIGVRGAFKECRDNIDYLEYFIQMFPLDWKECRHKLNLRLKQVSLERQEKKRVGWARS